MRLEPPFRVTTRHLLLAVGGEDAAVLIDNGHVRTTHAPAACRSVRISATREFSATRELYGLGSSRHPASRAKQRHAPSLHVKCRRCARWCVCVWGGVDVAARRACDRQFGAEHDPSPYRVSLLSAAAMERPYNVRPAPRAQRQRLIAAKLATSSRRGRGTVMPRPATEWGAAV